MVFWLMVAAVPANLTVLSSFGTPGTRLLPEYGFTYGQDSGCDTIQL